MAGRPARPDGRTRTSPAPAPLSMRQFSRRPHTPRGGLAPTGRTRRTVGVGTNTKLNQSRRQAISFRSAICPAHRSGATPSRPRSRVRRDADPRQDVRSFDRYRFDQPLLSFEKVLDRLDDRGIDGDLQADAIREDVPDVGIGHEDLAKRTNPVVRGQEPLAVGPTPLAAE